MKSAVKVARFWLERTFKASPLPVIPELDPDALALFEEKLGEAKFYLEFGTGGSTVMAAKLQVPTLSVESDKRFARRMARFLGPESSAKIIFVDIGLTTAWGRPAFERPTPRRIAKWSRYSAAAWNSISANQFPDFVLIDGRFRRACALEVARRTVAARRMATVLFDDYFGPGRSHYKAVEKHLGPPRKIGRAALFEISSDGRYPVPCAADLADAHADPR